MMTNISQAPYMFPTPVFNLQYKYIVITIVG